jgi:hypothetical protein
MFGTKAGQGQKRSFILCNQFSRSPDEAHRFRAILFLKMPARSIAEHWLFSTAFRSRRWAST